MGRPCSDPTTFVDGIDHEKRPRRRSLAGRIERAQELFHRQVLQAELGKEQCSRIPLSNLLAHHKHSWSALDKAALGDIAQQVGLASPRLSVQEEERLTREACGRSREVVVQLRECTFNLSRSQPHALHYFRCALVEGYAFTLLFPECSDVR